MTTLALTITDSGLAAAMDRTRLKLELQITHAALGSGAYAPDPSYRSLQRLVEAAPVTATGENGTDTNRISGVCTFPARQSTYQASELGLYAGHPDQGGVLVMLYSSATPMLVRGGFDFDLTFSVDLLGTPHGTVTVQINPDAPVALRELGRHVNDPDAHSGLARKVGLAVQAYSSGQTAGSGGAYTLDVAVQPVELVRFARVQALIHETHIGGAATLAVGTLPAAGIKLYDANGAKVDPGRGRMVAGMIGDFEFDGTAWVLTNPIPAHATTLLTAANLLITPTPTGGDGSELTPFIVPDAASAPGVVNAAVATVKVMGLRPGEFVLAADIGDATNGNRFTPGSVAARVANGQGVATIPVTFTDAPSSAVGARHTMDLAINNLRIRHRRSISSAAVVSTPSVTAPANGSTGLTNRPTFTATAYAVTGGTAAFASADWQVSLSSSFDVIVTEANVTASATQWTPAGALPYGRDYFVRLRHKGAGGLTSPWSSGVMFSVHAAPAVAKPRIIDPSAGTTGVAVQPRFSSSALQVTNAAGNHAASDWQVSISATDWLTPVASITASAADLVAWTPASPLAYTTDLYVRVRHRDGTLGYSEWSDPVKFTTAAATPKIATPAIVAPAASAVGFAGPFTSTAFRMISGSDMHVSSDWQIGTTGTFGTVVASADGDTTNKVSWPLQTLPRGIYFVRVRHNGRSGGSSGWSPAVQFTWIATQKPTITFPANNATNVDQGLVLASSAFASSGQDTHMFSDWQVATSADFLTGMAASVSGSTSSLVTWSPAGLKPLTKYYARCRHNGQKGGLSDWSTTVTFTTAASSGIVWATKSTGVAGVLRDVAYGGGKLVVVGSSTLGSNGMGAIMVSGDGGATFAAPIESLNGLRIGAPYAVIYTGTRWITAGYEIDGSLIQGAAYVSTDSAATWRQYPAGRGSMRDLATNGAIVVGVGLDDSLDPIVKTTTDGTTWKDGVDLRQIAGPLLTVEWAPELGLWIAGGLTTANSESAGVILTSPDLTTWSQASIPTGIGAITKLRWNGRMGVAVGMTSAASPGAGAILTTVDGRTWVRRAVDCGALFGVEWALSKWVAVGYTKQGLDSAGEAWTSPDGSAWTARQTGSGRLTAVAQVSAPGQAGPVAAVGFTQTGTTTAGGVYVS